MEMLEQRRQQGFNLLGSLRGDGNSLLANSLMVRFECVSQDAVARRVQTVKSRQRVQGSQALGFRVGSSF